MKLRKSFNRKALKECAKNTKKIILCDLCVFFVISVVNGFFYWTKVNFRLKPKLVLEVGKVFATNGSFII